MPLLLQMARDLLPLVLLLLLPLAAGAMQMSVASAPSGQSWARPRLLLLLLLRLWRGGWPAVHWQAHAERPPLRPWTPAQGHHTLNAVVGWAMCREMGHMPQAWCCMCPAMTHLVQEHPIQTYSLENCLDNLSATVARYTRLLIVM
jgi:hypothetical protein